MKTLKCGQRVALVSLLRSSDGQRIPAGTRGEIVRILGRSEYAKSAEGPVGVMHTDDGIWRITVAYDDVRPLSLIEDIGELDGEEDGEEERARA